MKPAYLSVLLLLLLPSLSHAQQEAAGAAIGLRAGTTGISAEFSTPVSDGVNLRLAYNWLEYDTDFDTDDVDYDGEILKKSLSLIADWHLNQSSFRISGGVFHHFDNEVSVVGRASSNQSYEFNGTQYSADSIGSLVGSAEFRDTTPYLGIGWSNANRGGSALGLSLDIGALYQSSARLSLSARNCNLPGELCSQLDADLAEEERSLQDDLDDYEWWPVVNFGIHLRF